MDIRADGSTPKGAADIQACDHRPRAGHRPCATLIARSGRRRPERWRRRCRSRRYGRHRRRDGTSDRSITKARVLRGRSGSGPIDVERVWAADGAAAPSAPNPSSGQSKAPSTTVGCTPDKRGGAGRYFFREFEPLQRFARFGTIRRRLGLERPPRHAAEPRHRRDRRQPHGATRSRDADGPLHGHR